MKIKPVIYRSIYLFGIIILGVSLYLSATLSEEDYLHFLETNFSFVLHLGGAFSIIFYVYAFLYSLYDVVNKRRKHIATWLIIIVFLPIIGSYLYFEKYIIGSNTISQNDHNREQFVIDPDLLNLSGKTGLLRVIAAVIDYFLFIMIGVIYTLFFGTETTPGEFVVTGFEAFMVMFITWLFIFPVFEYLFKGTIGKNLTGLKVILLNGENLTLTATIKRHLLDIPDLMLISWIPVLKGENITPRRLGDRWAKTVVLRKREIEGDVQS
jgi:uncharacterized RDD family membrane protein YckC